MKKMTAIMITALVALLAASMVVGAVDKVTIRGQVTTESFTWTPQNFAGFYYDLKKDIGREELTTTLTGDKKLSGDGPNYGVVYKTTMQGKAYERDVWGSYKVIGFLANRYFAGYIENNDDVGKNILWKESTDENSLADEQLEKILIDNKDEITVTSGTPLKLEEGYELSIKSIDVDGNKVYVELTKDGQAVDSKVVSPSKTDATDVDKTYYYKKDVGEQKGLIIIAIHFKNAFRGADQDIATIDGKWQISETPTEVKADTEYDKMTISTVDANAGVIEMNNKDSAITLSKNKDTLLMENIHIKTADNDTLRYYIYKEITEPGTYEIRGAVAKDNNVNSITWTPQNFAGFYYDLKKDLGKEELTATLTGEKKLSGDAPYGLVYKTTMQGKDFERDLLGTYKVIGFLANNYFAGYIENTNDVGKNVLFKESTDENSLADEQLEKVLIDDKTELTVTSGTPLKLEEGYELAIKSIDVDGNKVYVELTKDGQAVDSKVVSPSKTDATEADKIYYYKKDVGDQKGLIIIAVHFKNAFRGADQDIATIDGKFQISETPTEVKADTEYDKMTISTVDATNGVIEMNNKDNAITLSKNKDTLLMENIHIKTADNDTLRYYIYKQEIIEGAEAVTEEVAPVEAETAPAVNVTEEKAPVEEAAANVTEAAKEEVKEEAKTAAENATKPAEKGMPGFEAVFAVAGLLAVAYLVNRRN